VSLRRIIDRPLGRFAKPLTYLFILGLPLSAGIISHTWPTSATPVAVTEGLLGPVTAPPMTTAAGVAQPGPFRNPPIASTPPLAAEIDDASIQVAAAVTRTPQIELEPEPVTEMLQVARGDTLMRLLQNAGVDRQEAHSAITALRDVFSPRDLRPGQKIEVAFAPGNNGEDKGALQSLRLQPSPEQDIRVVREDAAFVARAIDRPLVTRTSTAAGVIESSLSAASNAADIPIGILTDAIHVYSFSVDFQREIQKGDSFEFFYETRHDDGGRMVKTGELLYANLTLSGSPIVLYRYEKQDGTVDYFDTEGKSVKRTLMRTPIDGARMSSGFGMRKHPILGYSKMHRGTDFAAPRGTPIYAAGDGVIERAGRHGAYGKYIRIRHNGTYKTAYAHMARFAKGMKQGRRVKQGQVIGYVGSTGRSTGPHLHYEVIKNNKQVNPQKIKLPTGEKLKGDELADFQNHRREIDRLRSDASERMLMVDAACGGEDAEEYGEGSNPGC